MSELRRKFLKSGASAALLAPLIGSGLLMPTRVLAAEWNKNAFTARSASDALKAGPVLPYVKAQLKMAETTRLRAVVKTTDGKSYVAFREIKVTLGGCGG